MKNYSHNLIKKTKRNWFKPKNKYRHKSKPNINNYTRMLKFNIKKKLNK